MKKKYLYSLLTTYMLTLGGLSSCTKSQPKPAQPQKPKITYVYKRPKLKVRIDTLTITDENYKHAAQKGAGGVFFSGSNTVVVYHFLRGSDSSRIQKYCELNNQLQPLFMRHEMEHARKQDLTHNTDMFSPLGRAEVAAMNEIMAPASEIIEAVDYHASTGKKIPCCKTFVNDADSVIMRAYGGFFIPQYVSYNYQPIADAVILYALENFKSSVSRGYYKHTIKVAYNRVPKHTSQSLVTNLMFNPDFNRWDPLWEFESNMGTCNPYRNASFAVRQKLIETVDSIVFDVTKADKFEAFYKNALFR